MVDLPEASGQGMTEQVFRGSLQHQLTAALSYIDGYVIKRRTFKHNGTPVADVVANYPYAAVEENLSNAVYHRSYQIPEPITVRSTPDAMESTSFPGFDRSISQSQIDSFDLRCDRYRNRRIGDFLKELGLSEGRNTGFPKALAALEANGSAKPAFSMDEARGSLTVRLDDHPSFRPKSDVPSQKDLEYRERIKDALKGGPLSLSELSRSMGCKSIPRRLSVAIEKMTLEGAVAKVASGGLRTKIALVVRQ